MEIKGVIQVVAGNKKGFIIAGQEGWFNATDTSLLEKFNKGDEVIVTYELNGKIKKVSMISPNEPKTSAPVETKKEPVPAAPKAPEPAKQEIPKQSSTGFACVVCGKELKNGTFKKCYECNMAAKTTPAVSEEVKTDTTVGPKCIDCGVALKDDKYTKCYPCNLKNPVKKQWKPKTGGYDSPEKTAQIQKGNSLNAAASVLCGADCLNGQSPEAIAEITKVVANSLLDYLRQD